MFNKIEEVIEDFKNGKMVIMVDDENRENEGDIVIAGQFATNENINFMATYAKGLICVPIREERANKLGFNQMVENNEEEYGTAFTVSVDHANTTTGIAPFERAVTIQGIVNKEAKKSDFKRPGHIFPLVAKDGGVLKRTGHTEGSVDLCKLAGLEEVAVICEIVKDDGTMARVPDLMEFAQKHGLKIISIEDLVKYRREREVLIERVVETNMPTTYGEFKAIGYINKLNGEHHVALVKGNINNNDDVLVRVHSECLTGDVFHSLRCDCGEQLDAALKRIAKEGKGVLLYMRQEGRGIGLINKLKAYKLQDKGMDTVEANLALGFPEDMREYGIGAQILKDLGIKKMKLMTNNPKKISGLNGYGLEVVDRCSIEFEPNKNNEEYLRTKKEKMGHYLK